MIPSVSLQILDGFISVSNFSICLPVAEPGVQIVGVVLVSPCP